MERCKPEPRTENSTNFDVDTVSTEPLSVLGFGGQFVLLTYKKLREMRSFLLIEPPSLFEDRM